MCHYQSFVDEILQCILLVIYIFLEQYQNFGFKKRRLTEQRLRLYRWRPTTVNEEQNVVQNVHHNNVYISLFLGSSKEYAYSLSNRNFNSRFAQMLLENGHPMGAMEDIMQILHLTDMGPHTKTNKL